MGFKEAFMDFFTEPVPANEDTAQKVGMPAVKSPHDLTLEARPNDLDATDIQSSTDIVSEAYTHFKSNGFDIFKIEELYANFEGIPEDTKNLLIRKNLETLNINLPDLIAEAKQRKSIIEDVAQEHVTKSENLGKDIESQIADAKARIDELSAQNIERKNKIAAELAGARAETTRLDAIITILGGATNEIH